MTWSLTTFMFEKTKRPSSEIYNFQATHR